MNIKKVLGEKIHLTDLLHLGTLAKKIGYKMFGGVHLVVRGGLARTFQNIRLFREMTVIENLLIAQHHNLNHNLISGVFQSKDYKLKEKKAVSKAYEILDLFHMTEDANKISSSLPYGKERKIEIARALCCNSPSVICLDEPAAGLNPAETDELSETIRDIRDKMNITIFLIEHDMSMVMKISDYVVVLDHGKTITKGKPNVVKNDPKVIEAYLGKEATKEKKK
jgi:branched-chain amino acid transport system ATP-binding protein